MPNHAPTSGSLQGDSASFVEGGGAVRLDAGGNVTFTEQDLNGFQVRRVGIGFREPLLISPVPGDPARVFVLDRIGRIEILDPATGARTLFIDLGPQTIQGGENGLLGFATAPDFLTSGTFYVYLTNAAGDNEVQRYQTVPGNLALGDPATKQPVLTVAHPNSSAHNGGWIGFGADDLLYIATGDGQAIPRAAQDTNSLLGKILRLDVSQDGFPADPARTYAIPASNPFAAGGGAGEVWVLGLRNPYRASFDPDTGNLYIGDVGGAQVEEVDLARPGDGGKNYGWPAFEGTRSLLGGTGDFAPPITEYDRVSGPISGRSITGGHVYRGSVTALQDQYIFGDFVTGAIWSIPLADIQQGTTLPATSFRQLRHGFTPDVGSISLISGFGTDGSGNLYIADYASGGIFRVGAPTSANFAGGTLTVAITQNRVDAQDVLAIDTIAASGVTLSNAMNAGSRIAIGGQVVGVIAIGGRGRDGEDLEIFLASGATPPRLATLVRAVGYANGSADAPVAGTRTITWTLDDGGGTADGGTDTLTITSSVTVVALDDPGIAVNDAANTAENTAVTIAVLANDSDVDGPAPAIATIAGVAASIGSPVSLASGATATLAADGTIRYDPAGAFDATPAAPSGAANTVASDSFGYTLAGGAAAIATIAIAGVDSNDRLLGTTGDDTLSGGAGNDEIMGGSGFDTGNWSGDPGAAYIDLMNGRATQTALTTGTVVASTPSIGSDRLSGIEAAMGTRFGDRFYGTAGGNSFAPGAGADIAYGFGGIDTLDYRGSAGAVFLDLATSTIIETALTTGTVQSTTARVSIDYAYGFENIIGTSHGDRIYGTTGDNVIDPGAGNDIVYGAGGSDTIDYTTAAGAFYVDLAFGYASESGLTTGTTLGAGQISRDQLYGIANATGSTFGDRLYGTADANILDGGPGNDILYALGGNDRLIGGDGIDILSGGIGGDAFVFLGTEQGGPDRITGYEAGIDSLRMNAAAHGYAPGDPAILVAATNPVATQPNSFLYDTDSGMLAFDTNGAQPGGVREIASLPLGTMLTAADIVFYA